MKKPRLFLLDRCCARVVTNDGWWLPPETNPEKESAGWVDFLFF